ncbi:MAG: FHA domain-containing protein, partial [Anaerolineae bacterium]
MPEQFQLEIVGPSGETEFRDLDPARGVVNIGRHPDNDVVIDNPSIAPFHALIDYRTAPFQIMLLSDEGEASLQGQRLAANVFQDLHAWDTFEIDGYAIILLESGVAPAPAAAPRPPVPSPPAGIPTSVPAVGPESGVAPVASPEPAALPGPITPPARLAPFPDRTDDQILTEITGREWAVDVDSSVSCQVTVINGGDIVAAFDVRVEGLPEEWVTITPDRVNLNEGGRQSVVISFAPPREPDSRAGAHPLAIVVTSPNYPDRLSQIGATLHVNPYYEFTVGDLSPRQQTISYRKRVGEVAFLLANQGNDETLFQLAAEDEERGCRFEFQIPGAETGLVRQAELRLAPAEAVTVPVQITPLRRRLIALRARRYAFTITTSMTNAAHAPRSIMGQLKARALIGPWLMLLALLLLAGLAIFFFMPNAEPALTIDDSSPQHGEAVTLEYNAARFPGLNTTNILNHQNSFFLRLRLEYRPGNGSWQVLRAPSELDTPGGSVDDVPPENGSYRLRAESWISQLIPALAGTSREVQVFTTPIRPEIVRFAADQPQVLQGEEVMLFWQVSDAESLSIEYNNISETLDDAELQGGQRSFTVNGDTTFTLVASNSSWEGEVRLPLTIEALRPTPTPIPTPAVIQFDANPGEITAGESVRIVWEVSGADWVDISNLGDTLPLKGDVGASPSSSTFYELQAWKEAGDGNRASSESLIREVLVNPQPTATPVPLAPVIDLFQVTPKEVILGDNQVVKLTWSVSGQTTNVEITAPNFQLSGLKAQEVITVTPGETTLYVLTAYNGELSTSAPAEVTVLLPTPTATPTAVPTAPPTPTPTPTPFPPPVISYFKAEGQDPNEDKVTFKSTYEGQSGPVYVYEVEASSRVRLTWGVKDA